MANKCETTLSWAATYHRLGWCVIPIPLGRKAPAIRWKRYQTERPTKDRLAQWFKNEQRRNIAVVLGQVSGELACRDFDTRSGYEAWASQHSDLANVLPTARTPRGYHVYFQAEVQAIRYFGTGDGLPAGELRGERCCCILPPSVSEDSRRYTWVIPPTEKNLIWFEPSRIEQHFCSPPGAADTEGTDGDRWELRGERRKKRVRKSRKIEKIIIETLPTRLHTRHRRIFTFARKLKSLPEYGNVGPRAFRSIVSDWHKRASPNIATKEFVDTWADFLTAWSDVKYKEGEEPMTQIFARVVKSKPPSAAVRMYSGDKQIQLLAALCRELQLEAGDKPFFLSVRTVGTLFNVTPMTGWRWLYALVQDEFLAVTWKGRITKTGPRATRFRYIRPLRR